MSEELTKAPVRDPGDFLRGLVIIVTVGTFGTQFLECVTRGAFDASGGLQLGYIGLLMAYAGQKEVRRWQLLKKLPPEEALATMESAEALKARKGEFYVALWWIFWTLAFVASKAWPVVFVVPKDLFKTCVEILSVFFGTTLSKELWKTRQRRWTQPQGANPDVGPVRAADHKAALLAHVRAQGRITNQQAQELLGLSRMSVWRLLEELEREAVVVWDGSSRQDPDGAYRLKNS
jgi:hypothetical protein